jgi:hypothetical protein
MTSQATKDAETLLNSVIGGGNSNSLDLLTGMQALSADVFAITLIGRAKNKQLHGVLEPGDWFYGLNDAQQAQVIEYFDAQLTDFGLKLNWFSRGHIYGFRFIG